MCVCLCVCLCVCVIMCTLKLVQCVSVSGRGRHNISCIPHRAYAALSIVTSVLYASLSVLARPQSSAQILTTIAAHLILAIGLATDSPRLPFCSPSLSTLFFSLLSFSSLAPLQMKICSVWFISLSFAPVSCHSATLIHPPAYCYYNYHSPPCLCHCPAPAHTQLNMEHVA